MTEMRATNRSISPLTSINPGRRLWISQSTYSARAKLAGPEEPLRSYAWSTWPAYLVAPAKPPAWLHVERLLGEHGIPKGQPNGEAAA